MISATRVTTFSQKVTGFAVLAEKTARAGLTYRMAMVFQLLATGLAYSVIVLVWLQIYRENPKPGPLPLASMLAYLVTAFVASQVLDVDTEWRVFQRVRLGVIATDVVRPLGFVTFQMAQAMGDVFVNCVFALPILAVGAFFVGGALVPPTLGLALLGVLSAMLAFFVSFGVSFLIVQAAFVLHSGYGVMTARVALQQVFSGLAAPLVMFPEGLRDVAAWLPFRHIIETPVTIWLGHARLHEIPHLLLGQVAWGFTLIAAGAVIFQVVLQRHQVQGG